MHEEIELSEEETIFDKAARVQEIGLLSLQGYTYTDIRERTGLSIPTIKSYVNQYKSHIQKSADDNPYFLEETQYNTLVLLAELDNLSKEAYETVEIATREGMVPARTQAIKLALDVATKKAALYQLMGGTKTDGEYIARMQKAETVNQLVSKVIRDIVKECDVCRDKAKVALREAFAMMESDEKFDSADDAADHLDFEDEISG